MTEAVTFAERPRRACVIGAGLSGLALAVRLQAAGIETVLVEARDAVGGRSGGFERAGFHFDRGPAALTDPVALAELWQVAGQDLAADLALLPVDPGWRCNWTDGAQFDFTPGSPELAGAVARFAPGDVGGLEEFNHHTAGLWRELRSEDQAGLTARAIARFAPALVRHHGWRSAWGMAAHFVKDEHLREALVLPVLLKGANPYGTPASQLALHQVLRDGLRYPVGGMGALAAALAGLFKRLGGTLRLHDPVLHIHLLGNRASEVEAASGWRERFDVVASNADVLHTYRDLLTGAERGREVARKLSHKAWSPARFTVHFGLEGGWPGIPHQTILFGPRFKGLIDDVFTHGVLPQDQLIALSHPSVTDPGVAPPGKSTFSASIPVAHLGQLPIDWETVGELIERRILAEVGRRLIPDLPDRIVTKLRVTPRDTALEFSAAHGSAHSLALTPAQSGWLRTASRDRKIANLYFVGAATAQGAGTAGALASARATAKQILEQER